MQAITTNSQPSSWFFYVNKEIDHVSQNQQSLQPSGIAVD
jgi:hypothetical protein